MCIEVGLTHEYDTFCQYWFSDNAKEREFRGNSIPSFWRTYIGTYVKRNYRACDSLCKIKTCIMLTVILQGNTGITRGSTLSSVNMNKSMIMPKYINASIHIVFALSHHEV